MTNETGYTYETNYGFQFTATRPVQVGDVVRIATTSCSGTHPSTSYAQVADKVSCRLTLKPVSFVDGTVK